MLGRICAVTTVVPRLDDIEVAYSRYLQYRVAARGRVPADVAAAWQAPAVADRPYLVMQPTSGAPVFLRFVEGRHPPGYRALTTFGWNATEILAQDPDELAARFAAAQSPFRIIGEPRGLTRFPMIRAMQALGPGDECLYFTRVGEGSGLDLPQAQCFVDYVFIAVAGGPSLAGMLDWYRRFGNAIDPPVATPVRVISWANGLPADSRHEHALVSLSHGTHIELDQYPVTCRERPCLPEELPPGMAMVSLAWQGVEPVPAGPPVAPALLPGLEQTQATVLVGASGERVELLAG